MKSRWTKWVIGLLTVIMVGCSPAMLSSVGGLIGLGGDKPAIESEIRIAGEANDSVVVGESTAIEAETVNITEIVTNNFSWPLLIIAIAGWMLPTPYGMGKWVWQSLKKRIRIPPRKRSGISKKEPSAHRVVRK